MPVLCPLWGCGRIVRRMAVTRAIRLLWTALCLGGNRARENPQGYATVPLPDHRYLIIIEWRWDFPKLIPWVYARVSAGVLPLETSLHNGTARPGLMLCMDGCLFYGCRLVNDLTKFKQMCDGFVINRYSSDLDDLKGVVLRRDRMIAKDRGKPSG